MSLSETVFFFFFYVFKWRVRGTSLFLISISVIISDIKHWLLQGPQNSINTMPVKNQSQSGNCNTTGKRPSDKLKKKTHHSCCKAINRDRIVCIQRPVIFHHRRCVDPQQTFTGQHVMTLTLTVIVVWYVTVRLEHLILHDNMARHLFRLIQNTEGNGNSSAVKV